MDSFSFLRSQGLIPTARKQVGTSSHVRREILGLWFLRDATEALLLDFLVSIKEFASPGLCTVVHESPRLLHLTTPWGLAAEIWTTVLPQLNRGRRLERRELCKWR